MSERVSKQARRQATAMRGLLGAFLVGAVCGAGYYIAQDMRLTIPPAMIGVILLVLVVLGSVASVAYWRNIDEAAREAHKFACPQVRVDVGRFVRDGPGPAAPVPDRRRPYRRPDGPARAGRMGVDRRRGAHDRATRGLRPGLGRVVATSALIAKSKGSRHGSDYADLVQMGPVRRRRGRA